MRISRVPLQLIGFAIVLFGVVGVAGVPEATAQYLFLDVDGDSISGPGDELQPVGSPTVVDVWLVTNGNRDASPASCSSGSGELTINSYEVILRATGGTVTFGPLTNHLATYMSTHFGHAQSDTDFYEGWGGGTSLTGGKYRLCSIVITAVADNPSITVASSTPLGGPFQTSFGSQCPGVDLDNTMKFGTDWADVDGLLSSSSSELGVLAPPSAAVEAGEPVSIQVAVTGGMGGSGSGLTLEVLSLPQGAETVFGAGSETATVHWVPQPNDAGTHVVRFRATMGGNSAEATTSIEVGGTPGGHQVRASRAIRHLAAIGPNSGHPRIEIENGQERISLFLDGDASDVALAARGVHVRHRLGRRMTASCIRDSLSSLLLSSDLDAIIEPPIVELALDMSAPSAGADGLRTHPTGAVVQGVAGKDVIVGIVDSGIDVTHPDFHKTGSDSSRIVAYWDQSTGAGSPPTPFYFYGSEWTPGTSESLFYYKARTYSKDTSGHGTHVAGIAAGNGNYDVMGCAANRYMGVAPRADIIAVKLNSLAYQPYHYPSSVIIEAIDYVIKRAKTLNKPAAINLSLGTQYGPHDGLSFFDQYLDTIIVNAGPGYIVVAAAGNDGNNDIHGTAEGNSTTKNEILFEVPEHTPAGGGGQDSIEIYAWFDLTDSISVTVRTPGSAYSLGPVEFSPDEAAGQGAVRTPHGFIFVWTGKDIESQYTWGSSPQPPFGAHIVIRADTLERIEPGLWSLEFTPLHGPGSILGDGRVDAYLTRRLIGAGPVKTEVRMYQQPTSDEALASPASADQTIAVGAYSSKECWKDVSGLVHCTSFGPGPEKFASFSSHGPRRDGVLKPDIVAPGTVVVSALSQDAAVTDTLAVLGGGYSAMAGTSMAAPHVTGAVALLLADPAWRTATPAQIRERLKFSAKRDTDLMGPLPNKVWGSGKLDVARAIDPDSFAIEVFSRPESYLMKGGVLDSLTIEVRGAATTSAGVAFELVPAGWCYGTPISLGSAPQLTAGQVYTHQFTVPSGSIGDTVRIRISAAKSVFNNRSAWTRYQYRVVSPSVTAVTSGEPGSQRFDFRLGTSNPAGSGFMFLASLSQPGELTVRVFSVDGRMILARRESVRTPGIYRHRWSGNDMHGRSVGSGVYFIEAMVGRERIVRKVAVMK